METLRGILREPLLFAVESLSEMVRSAKEIIEANQINRRTRILDWDIDRRARRRKGRFLRK